MKYLNVENYEEREGTIKSDGSHFFQEWGSRKPMTVVSEEIDNQLAAEPTMAGLDVKIEPLVKSCTITTYNNGKIPTPERMEDMCNIGWSYSDKNGASLCGEGQIMALVAGRKSEKSVSTLEFTAVNNHQKSKFTCFADGRRKMFRTLNSGPFDVDEPDRVSKEWHGMAPVNLDDVRALAGVKINPTSSIRPDFEYRVNGEVVEPIDILYNDVEDDRIKRTGIQKYENLFNGVDTAIEYGVVDVARFLKPDGKHFDETNANANLWDKVHKMDPKHTGVFVEVGGSMVICGGLDSWAFIGDEYHSTRNGIYIWIKIPYSLKSDIFAESPKKSEVGITLSDLEDINGEKVFGPLCEKIQLEIEKLVNMRPVVGDNGKVVDKDRANKIKEDVLNNNPTFSMEILKAFETLTPDEKAVIGNGKVGKLVSDIERIIKEKEPCYSNAK